MVRRFAICFAFAFWCFLNVWVELSNHDAPYFARYNPWTTVVFPVAVVVLISALLMATAWEIARRKHWTRHVIVHWVFLALCLMPPLLARAAVWQLMPPEMLHGTGQRAFHYGAWLAVAAVAIVSILRPRAASATMRGLLLYSYPVLLLMIGRTAVTGPLAYAPSMYREGQLAAPAANHAPRVRVVWILFDELSQAVAFNQRPPGLALPNLDRLRNESFHADAAESPADSTLVSLPALILGEAVAGVATKGPSELEIRQVRAKAVADSWSSIPNVFDAARQMGFNTALVGWYHPYGRLLNRSLTRCYWTAASTVGLEEPTRPRRFFSALWARAVGQFFELEHSMPGADSWVHVRTQKRDRFLYLKSHALEIAADPAIGLALVHLPVPHPPAIFDRSTGRITTARGPGYLDNIALADRTLGELREAMERAGVWDRTAVLVSADHGWRDWLWRDSPWWNSDDGHTPKGDVFGVPFLLKLPGQTSAIDCGAKFNTLVTRDLITRILSETLTRPDEIAGAIRADAAESQAVPAGQ